MKIELGKQYQTRDGRKVRILCVDRKGAQPILGLVDFGSSESAMSWFQDGAYSGPEHELDLITEKRRLKGMIYVFPIGAVFSQEGNPRNCKPIGTIPIDLEYEATE